MDTLTPTQRSERMSRVAQAWRRLLRRAEAMSKSALSSMSTDALEDSGPMAAKKRLLGNDTRVGGGALTPPRSGKGKKDR